MKFLRNEARRCRRLAAAIGGGEMSKTLGEMADEYDRRADELSGNDNAGDRSGNSSGNSEA
jgi:hypothetical protein